MGYVRKDITIRSDQEEFIEKSDVNLSKVTQDALDELMS